MRLRRAVVIVIAMGVGAGCKKTARPPSEDLQLVRVAPKVGERQTVRDRLDSKMKVSAQGQVVELLTTRTRAEQIEVLAVAPDGIVTKVRVRYDEHHSVETRDGKAETKPSALEGRTYLAAGEPLVVTHDDGGAVTPDEAQQVVADVGRSVGKRPAIATLLLARRWHPGDPVTLSADELAGAFGQNPMMKPTAGTALLVGVTDGVAMFEFDLTLAREGAESPTRMTVKLDVAHFRPVEMALIGTLGGTIEGMATTGTLDGRITFTYE